MLSASSLSSAGCLDTVSNIHLRSIYDSFDRLSDLGWLSGDLVAGLTVGLVLVPQGMSYAQVIPLLSSNASGSQEPVDRYTSASIRPILVLRGRVTLLCKPFQTRFSTINLISP